MTEEEARLVLLVRAVEIEDAAATLLTKEDRQQATIAALASQAANGQGRHGDEALLALRAHFATGRLATRVPAIDSALRASRWPGWLGWAIPIFAFVLGIATNEIGGGKRLNLIAFPLVGMLAWNVAVYLAIVFKQLGKVARARTHSSGRLSGAVAWLSGLSRLRGGAEQPLGRALTRFATEWTRASGPLTASRAHRMLHFGAAAFATGVVAGMYLRALGIEYRAGWESTFLSAGLVHQLLGLVLGPASLLSGIRLPDAEHLAGLRWSAGRGENAGLWIHLYAMTALLFVFVPRVLLGIGSGIAAVRQRRRFPVSGREDFYVRRLLRTARGGNAEVRVVPYGFRPAKPMRTVLGRLLSGALGDGTRTAFDTPIAYGEEEEWLVRSGIIAEVDHLLVLFSMASTPEAENHGALVTGIRETIERDGGGTELTVIIDESTYRERLGNQSDTTGRIGARRTAWERMLSTTLVQPFFANLMQDQDTEVIRRLEAALVRTPTLASGRAAQR
ncbi:DUF2868 domain-containing protein [Sphingomonas sp. CFBP 13720]|uniref:DUF2868 domain-containing protein n=1 Tax=Sphingomonas sp. CFBP 13720 TaxID=2775302 RepID=UPI0017874C11|nr:DUF2868 domain-containing protein [Sphingomonas sp. CFBP 13720]MBD8680076.1 DUF2868 domain-containing protein [Sphingomonas sp. CFBP 13720]